MHFFRQSKDHHLGNKETGQMIPFFSSTFSAPFVTFISEFENTQNSFSCGSPPYGPFWSEKYHNFCPKATDLESSSYFKGRNFRETKFCEPKKSRNFWNKLFANGPFQHFSRQYTFANDHFSCFSRE